MNKIYKLVWSKVRNAWVVASETAKGHGKSSSSEGNGKRLKSLVLMALLGCFMTGLGQGVQADGTNSYSWGSESEAPGDQSVAAGNSAKALGEGSTAVGQGAQAIERFSTALGQNAHAEKEFSTAIGVSAQAKGAWSTALGQNAIAEKDNSTALGYYAQAKGGSSTAVGKGAIAEKDNSTALGNGAQAQADDSTAVGNGAQAKGHWSTAVGQGALADRENSTALGRAVQAQGNSSTAVGSVSQAKGDISTAIGFEVQADGYASVAIGKGAQTKSNCSIAVGDTAQTNGDISMALGRGAIADKNYAMALGNQAQALGESSIALGDAVKAEKDNSIAFGRFAQALVEGGIALGSNSIASIDKGVVGYDPSTGEASKDTSAIWQATRAALSVGNAENEYYLITRQITNVAAGSKDTDAVNVAQLKALNTKVDKGAVHYFSVKSGKPANTDRTNWDNDGATGEDAVAIGYGAQAKGNWSTALGYEAIAKVAGSVALGRDSIASIDKGVFGYDPFTGQASTETSAIWQATHAAFSVGSTSDKSDLRTRQITGVAAGTQDTDAVNVAQLKALERKLIKVLPEVVGDQNTGVVVEKNPKENTPTSSTGETTSPTGVTAPSADVTAPPTSGTALPTGGTVRSADVTAQPTGVTAQPTGVTTTTTAPTDEGKTVYKVKLDKKVDVGNISIDGSENKETITIGKGDNNVIVDNTGLTIANGPSVTKNGIDAKKNKITNVGDGKISKDSTDAVNGKQLYGVDEKVNQNKTNIYDMGMKVGELDTRVNKVGAGAAALAGLHPQDFDPEDKWDFSAAVGNYNGVSSVALGAFYRLNERTMISMGGTLGGEDNMVNLGVSLKTGSGVDGQVYTSRTAMAKEIKALKEKEAARDAVLQQMAEREAVKDAEITKLKEKDAQREEQLRKLIALVTAMQHK
ncbi:ESPR-type extended signal peptide-containing protein [Veillonella montpellierensis]|uniref:ESPR-type extended signal peptide-containing protein n=1 Tax=Veillonella montpellierensis TaxID=187328 RepID=UPI0023F7D0B5|nr:ESPR-type extended signal peptide-containing protein [Veillonella montpellierensis]